MSNREKRVEINHVHLYLALSRPSQGEKADCIRTIDKGGEHELDFLIAKLKIIGGYWRIHRTVNARDVQKARIWLMKDLLDHPEHASYIDSQWRTALLQPECKTTNFFMLDIDTQDEEKITRIRELLAGIYRHEEIKSPKGWHIICDPFDTRELLQTFPNDITLLRDGYYFICEVGEKNEKRI